MNADRLTLLLRSLTIRRNRLLSANEWQIEILLLHLWDYLQEEPLLKAFVDEVVGRHPVSHQLGNGIVNDYSFNLADLRIRSYGEIVATMLVALRQFHLTPASHRNQAVVKMPRVFSDGPTGRNRRFWPNFKAQLIKPVFDYLEEQLLSRQAIFGTLLRYKARSEFYNREELRAIAARKAGVKLDEIERRLKGDLNRYLHDQGLDFIVDPALGQGMIDYIVEKEQSAAGSRKTLVEGKVFDGKGRGKRYIVEGIEQAKKYAQQYHSSIIYLAIYDISKNGLGLEFPAEPVIHRVPRSGVDILVMVIDLVEGSISKRKPPEVTIKSSDLPE